MLEVIGAGYGRTGTYSLKTALEQLGFGPCYHAIELMRNPEHVPRWERAVEGANNWDEVFAEYRSTTDFPAVSYWRQLVDYYPDAKVVLTVRDGRKWFESVRNTILQEMNLDGEGSFGPPGGGEPSSVEKLMARMMDDDANYHDEEEMVARFERHNAEVQAYVPADRLLVFEVKQGWAPLCEFLGVDVPDSEFPRLNDSDSFKDLITKSTKE